jgi:hypothetical protein
LYVSHGKIQTSVMDMILGKVSLVVKQCLLAD